MKPPPSLFGGAGDARSGGDAPGVRRSGGVDGRVLGREAAVEAPGDEPPSSEKSSIGAVDVAVDEPTGGDVAKPSGTASVESSTKKASPE